MNEIRKKHTKDKMKLQNKLNMKLDWEEYFNLTFYGVRKLKVGANKWLTQIKKPYLMVHLLKFMSVKSVKGEHSFLKSLGNPINV